MKLIVDNIELDLSVDTVVDYNQSSPIFNALKGDYSYPFDLPGTAKNLAVFGNPHAPSSGADVRREFQAQIWLGSYLLGEGTLRLRNTKVTRNGTILIVNIEFAPGNIPKKIWQKNINKFDLGSDTIPDQAINYTIYKIDANAAIGTLVFPSASITTSVNLKNAIDRIFFKTNVNFRIGSTMYVNETVEPAHAELIVENAQSEIFKRILESYNAGQSSNQINYDDKQLLFIYEGNTTANLTLTFNYYVINGSDTIQVTNTFIVAPQNIRTITNYLNNSLLNTWTKPYFLPQISNTKLYGDKGGFNGIINKTTDGNILRNNSILYEKSKYSLVPMLKLKWVVEHLFSFLNFNIVGGFFSNVDIQKIIIFNLFTIDKLIDGVSFAINIYDTKITYANHLPEMKLGEFLQALIDEFGIGIEFNILSGTIDFFFYDEVLESVDYIDLSGRLSIVYESEIKDLKKKQLSWEIDSSDELAKNTEEIFKPNPTDEQVDLEDENTVEKLTLQFPSLIVNTEVIAGNTVRKIPEIKQPGISPLFDQSKNKNPKRFLFYENGKADNQTNNLYLSLYTNKGIYQKLLQQKLEMLNNSKPFKRKALMSLPELMAFRFKKKIFADGIWYLADELSVKLRKEQEWYEVEFVLIRII